MLGWLDLAIAVLKLLNWIFSYFHDRGLIDEGRRQVIAENLEAISKKVAVRDKIREQVDAMDDKQVDQALRDLEPPAGGERKS
jgi:hypothetical protein